MEQHIGYTNSAHFQCLEDLHRSSTDLYLSYCGTENCSPGFSFGPYVRTEYVIHVVTKGKGIFQIGDNLYHLEENQAFMIPPDVSTYYAADSADPWSYFWVGFNGITAYECVVNAGFTQKSPVISLSCTDQLLACVNRMLEAHQLTYANDLRRSGQLLLFLSLLLEEYQRQHPEHSIHDYPGSVYVKQAVNYLTRHYSERLKINDLAKYIGINRSYLTNSFKRAMNVSPQEFLVNLRMEKAASLLSKTSLPINTVADQVGYDDPLAFSKIFKQKFGMSPKSYRDTKENLVTISEKGGYTGRLPL